MSRRIPVESRDWSGRVPVESHQSRASNPRRIPVELGGGESPHTPKGTRPRLGGAVPERRAILRHGEAPCGDKDTSRRPIASALSWLAGMNGKEPDMTRTDKLHAADRLREIAADFERQAAELEAEALEGCEVEVEGTHLDD